MGGVVTDARYLVPLSALPFQPHGATLAWECKVCGWVWSPFTAPALSCEHIDGPEVVTCLDLSAPPERDGIPERLDALPWALAVLAKRINANPIDIDDIRPMDWNGNATTWEVRNRSGYVAILTPEDDGWEDYDHADPDQPRRIVAAALRKTHVQTESP